MKLSYLFTTLFFFFISVSFSQESKNDERFEIDMHKEFSTCGIVAFKDSSILLYCKNIKPNKSDFKWKISALNSNLSLVNESYLTVNKHAILQKITNDEVFTYFLFLNGRDELLTYRVHHKTLMIDVIQSEINKGITQLESVSHGNQLFLFTKSNGLVTLLALNFESKEVNISTPKFGNFPTDLKSIKVDSLNGSLLLTIERKHNFSKSPAVFFYDLNLKLIQVFEPNYFEEKHIQTIQVKSIGFNEYIYSGTFSNIDSDEDVIEGIYCLGIKNNNELFLEKVIPLNEINAFNRYLNEDGEETRELRKAKKNLITAVHEVIVTDDNVFIVAEFYGPTYTTGVGATVLFGGVGALVSYHFDGYLYKGSTLIAINDDQEIEWDVFVNLLPYPKPFTERLLVDVKIENDTIQLVYPYKEQTWHTTLDLDGSQVSQKEYQLAEGEIDKKQLSWYGNVYLDFGRFDKYIVYNEHSITDKVTVKHSGYFIEKYTPRYQ